MNLSYLCTTRFAQGVSDFRMLFCETVRVQNAITRYTGLSAFYIATIIAIFEDTLRYYTLAVHMN